jgi:crotonobetainyl-CoA:carnitine CoA-transferase CaiB-like acyl-CoA transferase
MSGCAVLAGRRVIALTHFAAGPIAAQYLGALGADVIKIESPQRDLNRHAVRDVQDTLHGLSPYFICTNRNQRGISVDLKHPDGKAIAQRLIAGADVVLENYRPGVLDKLDLGYESARLLNSKIVYCSFSAYDALGPARNRPGQDLIIQALSGLAALSGRADAPPAPVGVYAIDGFTAMQGVIGVLGALLHRDRTGEGQWVRADMMSTALYMMAQEASYVLNTTGGTRRSAAGIAHVHQAAPYGVYETRDGPIAISLFGGVEALRKLASALGILGAIEAHLTERSVMERRDDIAHAIAAVLRPMSKAQAISRLADAGAWAVPVCSLEEALADPAVEAAGTVLKLHSSIAGEHRVVGEPLRMSATPLDTSRAAPGHGEHTIEILRALGLDPGAIDALVKSGAVVAERPAAQA